MTNLQMQYHTLQENKRHNLQTEAKDIEANRIKASELDETRRSNRVNESIRSDANRITDRHNLVTEDQARAELSEKHRHNVHSEVAGYMSSAGQLLRGGAAAADVVGKRLDAAQQAAAAAATGRIGF